VSALAAVAAFVSLSFLGYGATCLFSNRMAAEFERYRLARWRTLVGLLEVAGALGVLAGLMVPIVGLLAASGLSILMLGGVGVRLRIRDGFVQTLPAATYLALTLYLTVLFSRSL
jgi:hypothetical protein